MCCAETVVRCSAVQWGRYDDAADAVRGSKRGAEEAMQSEEGTMRREIHVCATSSSQVATSYWRSECGLGVELRFTRQTSLACSWLKGLIKGSGKRRSTMAAQKRQLEVGEFRTVSQRRDVNRSQFCQRRTEHHMQAGPSRVLSICVVAPPSPHQVLAALSRNAAGRRGAQLSLETTGGSSLTQRSRHPSSVVWRVTQWPHWTTPFSRILLSSWLWT